MNSEIRFSLDCEGIHIQIHAVLKAKDPIDPETGIYELNFCSSKGEQDPIFHYWPSAQFPLPQDELMSALEHALDEEGIIDHILASWSGLESATDTPRWAKKSFKKA